MGRYTTYCAISMQCVAAREVFYVRCRSGKHIEALRNNSMSLWIIIMLIALSSIGGVLVGIWVFCRATQKHDEAHSQAPERQHMRLSAAHYFFRGFFIRLVYGSSAIPFLALLLLIRTYLLDQDSVPVRMVAIGSSFYLGICIVGGLLDAAWKPPARPLKQVFDVKLMWQETPRRTKIGTFLLMVFSAFMILVGH